MKVINAKFKSYCRTCFFTVFKNERVAYDGQTVHHVNCLEALRDKFPRFMDRNKAKTFGKVNRIKWAEQLEANGYKGPNVNHTNYKHRANRGVRLVTGR